MLTVKVYYYRIIISVILSLFFCTASGFLGVREIIKINPAESMKPEAPKEGKRIIIENIKIMWSHVPFTWKIVLRNIFREKKKFIFIAVSYTHLDVYKRQVLENSLPNLYIFTVL